MSGSRLPRVFHESMRLTSKISSITFRILILLSILFSAHLIAIHTNCLQDGPIFCPVRLIFGIPCPSCGITRSLLHFSLGNFRQAWTLNPFSYLLLILFVIWALNPLYIRQNKSASLKPKLVFPYIHFITLVFPVMFIWNIFRIMGSIY